MQRREFIAGLGSAAVWPVAARAQQRERMRRIGAFTNLASDDPETVRRMAALVQGLQELGWTEGRNVQIDLRSGLADTDAIADTRQSWSRLHQTSSWQLALQPWVRCNR
jgi:putative ABC transport system substrate-binding protein